MKFSLATLLFAAIFPSSLAGPVFDTLFNTEELIQGACDAVVEGLNVTDNFDCTCTGDATIFGGVEAEASCEVSAGCQDPENNILCASSGEATFSASTPGILGILGGDDLVTAELEACITIGTGLPPALTSLIPGIAELPPICISVEPGPGLQLESCSAMIGDTVCDGCVICEGSLSLTLDCSNFNLLSLSPIPLPGNIPGPNFEECIGIDFQQLAGAVPPTRAI